MESDTTCPWLRSPISGEPVLQKRSSVSTNDPWPRLGAKPKALISSTPSVPTQDEWITVRGAKRSRKPSPTNTSAVLQLEKRYKVLENLEEASIHTVHVPPSTSSLRSSHSQVKVPRCNPERPSPPVKPAVSIRPTSRQITNPSVVLPLS